MNSIWKGSISFGLVNNPVKCFCHAKQTLDFDMLDKGELCVVKFKIVCKDDKKRYSMKIL